jgi:hypothetical protein
MAPRFREIKSPNDEEKLQNKEDIRQSNNSKPNDKKRTF